MQRDNETRLQYLLRLKAELLLENIVEDDVRELLDDRQEAQPKPKRGRPANNQQPPPPPTRLQINGNNGGPGPAYRNDMKRLAPPPQAQDEEEQP